MRQLPSFTGIATSSTTDGIEIADVARTMRRQWRAVIAFLAIGVLGAIAVLIFAPRRYDGTATLLARAGNSEGAGSILSRIGNVGELMRGGIGGLGSQFESELQVLRSRAVAGEVLDSLQLQMSVRDPAGVPPLRLFAASRLPGRFAPRKYHFERTANGAYYVRYGGKNSSLTPGQPGQLDIGTVRLQPTGLPKSFVVKVYDREDGITRLTNRITATKAGGEVAKIRYRGEDSVTAAAVPNLIVASYLDRRKTVDRGINARRVEFVKAQLDETAAELAATERALRAHQEASGVFDAEVVGKAELEGAIAMRESLTVVQVEEGALNAILAQVDRGAMSARQIGAYPSFLRGTAVSSLLGELTSAEASRIRLLERRTEKDPEVIVIDQSIKALEEQILTLAQSYASSIRNRRAGLAAQVDSLQRRMLALPAAAERGGRMQRDVVRLTAIYTALQAQLVEARLAAIGEGGEVRQIDVAAVPRRASFPEPFMTLGIGTFGGLLAGSIAALFLGWFGRWLRDPAEIERLTGVSVQRFESDAPLLLTASTSQTVLVVPLGAGARSDVVAQRLARTATARSVPTKILDLSAHGNGSGAESGSSATALIEQLEREGSMLVVQLPGLSSEETVAALRETRPVLFVAPPGRVDRARLATALDVLRRLQVPCAGVVISDPPAPRAVRA